MVDHDRDAFVILGRAAQHRRAADVDVLNGFLEMNVLLGDGLLKRIQVHHDEIDHVDAMGFRGGLVVGLVATREEAAMNLRMECLHAAFHHLGKAGVLAHLGDGQTFFREQLGGAAGREQLVAVLFDEGGRKIDQTGFVAHRK